MHKALRNNEPIPWEKGAVVDTEVMVVRESWSSNHDFALIIATSRILTREFRYHQ